MDEDDLPADGPVPRIPPPAPLSDAGLKLAPVLAGKPLTPNATDPLKPLFVVTVIV